MVYIRPKMYSIILYQRPDSFLKNSLNLCCTDSVTLHLSYSCCDPPCPASLPAFGFWHRLHPGWNYKHSTAHFRSVRCSLTGPVQAELFFGLRGSFSACVSAVTLCFWPALLRPPPAPAAAVCGVDRQIEMMHGWVRSKNDHNQLCYNKRRWTSSVNQ